MKTDYSMFRQTIAIFSLLALVLGTAPLALAAARTTTFTVGETLDPGTASQPCGPTDTNCFPSINSLSPVGTTTGSGGIMKFLELLVNGTNSIGFRAPDAITADTIWTLPGADGTNNSVLTTNGAGLLSWIVPGASGNSTAGYFTATSTTATSTFAGGLTVGTSKLIVDGTTGNVGIGTTSPYAALSVAGSSVFTGSAIASFFNATSSVGYQLGGVTVLTASSTRYNTFVGLGTGASTTGTQNTAIGAIALSMNTNGGNNTATGYKSLYSNTTGNNNTANGTFSLQLNTIGSANTTNGYQSLYSNTTGGGNTASGIYSLYSNTTGGANTASGINALYYNTTGSFNTGIGDSSLTYNSTGDYSTALGYQSGHSNTTGYNNTFLGTNAGYTDGTVTTGATLTNATAIGYNAQVTANNALILGGTGAYAVNVGIGTTSPYAALSVVGASGVVADIFTSTSTTATSTFASNLSIATSSSYRIGGVPVLSYSAAAQSFNAGPNTATGYNTALGYGNTASESFASAVGYGNTASGFWSNAFGYGNYATTTYSNAFGMFNKAGGAGSIAMGYGNNAWGNYAIAIGSGITNTTARSLQIGPSDAAKLTILSTGNVGIGNFTPASRLDITNSATSSTAITLRDPLGNVSLELRAGTSTLANTFIGTGVGQVNTGGNQNTALGYQSLFANTGAAYAGSENTAVGYQSLYSNNGTSFGAGFQNTALGYQSLYSNTTGNENAASGMAALYSNTTGNNNTASGVSALYSNTTGTYNTALGFEAGYSNTTGNNNTFLGYNAGYTAAGVTTPGTLTNATAIGYNAQVTANNSLILGGTGAYGVNVGIGTTSPYSLLSLNGTAGQSTPLFTLASSTNTSLFSVSSTGNVAINNGTVTSGAAATLNVQSTRTVGNGNSDSNAPVANIGSYLIAQPSANDFDYYGNISKTTFNGTVAEGGGIVGSTNYAYANSTANINDVMGANNYAQYQNTGTVTNLYGSKNTIFNNSSTANGVTNGYAVYAKVIASLGANTMTNGYGVYIDTHAGNGITNSYGLYVQSDKSYFGGNVGIGTTSPYATLSVAGNGVFTGSATASSFNATSSVGYQLAGTTLLTASAANTFVGFSVGPGNTGSSNTGSGYYALGSNTTGSNNSAYGIDSIGQNSTGSYNDAYGSYSLFFNNTGSYNVAMGSYALLLNGGSANTATGFHALGSNGSASASSTAVGYYAGMSNTSGNNNTFLGYNAGYGTGVSTTTATLTNAAAIGSNAQVTASNALILGGTGAYGVNVGIGTTSPSTLLSVAGTSTLQSVIPSGPYTGNMSAYNIGATTTRWNAMWAGTYNVGTSTWSLSTSANSRFGIFNAASAGGSEYLSILNSNGNIGIGTTSPLSKLTVVGPDTLSTTNAFNVVNSAGTSLLALTDAGSLGVGGSINALNVLKSSGTLSDTIVSGTCLVNANAATLATYVGTVAPTTGDIFYNSTRNRHSRITTVTSCVDASPSPATHYLLTLTDSITSNAAGDSFMVHTPAGDLGDSASGYFNNIYSVNVKAIVSTLSGGFDVAEQYQTGDTTISAGDVVVVDDAHDAQITKSRGADMPILGVVSTNAALTLGGETGDDWKKVALSGRVPVKVNLEGGAIARGDYLTSSSEAGVAMKATSSANVIGQALSAFDGTTATTSVSKGTVTVFVHPGWQEIVGTEKTFVGRFYDRIRGWFADATNGISDFFANRVHTQELCVGTSGNETCITKDKLDYLLGATGASGSQGSGSGTNNTSPSETTASSTVATTTVSTTATSTSTIVATTTPPVIFVTPSASTTATST